MIPGPPTTKRKRRKQDKSMTTQNANETLHNNLIHKMVALPGILAAMSESLETVIKQAIIDAAALLEPEHLKMLVEAHNLRLVPQDGDELMALLVELATEAEMQLVPMEHWEGYQAWLQSVNEPQEQDNNDPQTEAEVGEEGDSESEEEQPPQEVVQHKIQVAPAKPSQPQQAQQQKSTGITAKRHDKPQL